MIPTIRLKVKQLYSVIIVLYTLNNLGGYMAFRNRFALVAFAGILMVSTAAFPQGSISESTDQGSSDTVGQVTADSTRPSPEVTTDSPADSSLPQQKTDFTQNAQPSIEAAVAEQVYSDSNKITAVENKPSLKYKSHLMGMGLDFGLQFFAPAEINEYLEDVYDRMDDGYYLVADVGTPRMFLGFNFGGQVMVRPIPWVAFGAIGSCFFAIKELSISTSGSSYDEYDDPEFSAVVMDGIVGGKVETYTSPAKTVSFKAGFSVEAHFATVELEQKHTVTLSGNGVGITPFAGISITPGRGIVMIYVDFMVPICKIDLDEVEGRFDRNSDSYTFVNGSPISLPKELNLTGLIIKPSVTICFP
jgi:hypothetical protein